MKIFIVGDVHWSQYSSILRKRGEKYSYRLENLIKSINWAESLANDNNCDFIVYLGDFFDRSEINSEELSALKAIKWSERQHYFLVGNHEAGRGDLTYNSADVFNLANFEVIKDITTISIDDFHRVVFLPYILETKRISLDQCLEKYPYDTIIFSHNDIAGIQMGQFISKEGFSIEEINNNCELFINGHLHNGSKVTDKIINIGNLSGQNFSEDAFAYDHVALILDTDTMKCACYKNPFAINFYRIDFTQDNDIDYINDISMKMGNNCVATIKCYEEDLEYLRKRFDPDYRDKIIPYNCNMVETRFIVQTKNTEKAKDKEEFISIDYLDQFSTYMINLLGNSDILQKELQEICR